MFLAMSIPTPLPRQDAHLKSTVISPKISQLHQIYTQQPPKISKQQQNELNKQLKQSANKFVDVSSKIEEKFNIPKRLLLEPNGKTTVSAVNSKFENLNKKINETDNDDIIKKHLNDSLRELNLAGSMDKAINSKTDVDSVIDIDGGGGLKGRSSSVKECVGIARRAFKSGRTRNLGFKEKQLKGEYLILNYRRREILI